MKRLLLVIAIFLALGARAGNAQVFFENICSPGAFRVCASAHAYFTGGTLVIDVWNENQATTGLGDAMAAYGSQNGGHHTIAAIGLSNLGPITASNATLLAQYMTASGAQTLSNWVLGANSLQLQLTAANTQRGHKEGIVGCYDPDAFDGTLNQGHVNTCHSSFGMPFVRFTISNLSGLTAAGLNNSLFEFHALQVADPNCQVNPTGPAPNCLTANSLKGEGTVTPEPVTMLLLGSGLLGIGGAARRRRRRAEPQTGNA